MKIKYLFQATALVLLCLSSQIEAMNKKDNQKKRKRIDNPTDTWEFIKKLRKDQFLNLCIGKNNSDALSFDAFFQRLEPLSEEQFDDIKKNGLLKKWIEKNNQGLGISGEILHYLDSLKDPKKKMPLFLPITVDYNEEEYNEFIQKSNKMDVRNDTFDNNTIEKNVEELDPSSLSDSGSDNETKNKSKKNKKKSKNKRLKKSDNNKEDIVEIFSQEKLERERIERERLQRIENEKREREIQERLQREHLERERLEREKKQQEENEQIENECPICFENMTENVVETPCHHKFHQNCINDAFKGNTLCPMCNQETHGKFTNVSVNNNQISQPKLEQDEIFAQQLQQEEELRRQQELNNDFEFAQRLQQEENQIRQNNNNNNNQQQNNNNQGENNNNQNINNNQNQDNDRSYCTIF